MKNLRKLREEKGFTQKQFAEKCNLSTSSYNQYETGKRQPDLEILKIIAKNLETSIDQIVGIETENDELNEYLEELKNRSEMRMLFSLAKGATKEDVEKAVAIIEALRKTNNG